jgi:hypothetical protein
MALDVYLQKDAKPPETAENHRLSLEDNGCFWFLYSVFEDISKETDQVFDLYEDAFFDGENLALLDRMVARARTAIAEKPEVWKEFTGTVVHQDKNKIEKLYSTVRKTELEALLVKFEKAVGEARERNVGMFFLGD